MTYRFSDYRNLAYVHFMIMDVMEDDNLNGRARIITHYNHGRPVALPGFSEDPALSDFQIREAAFRYYQKLKQVLYGTKDNRSRQPL